MVRKIFLWIGMSYSFLGTAQFANPVPTASGNYMSHSASKFSIGTGVAPTAVLDVNGDVKLNLSGTQQFSLLQNFSYPTPGAPNTGTNNFGTDPSFYGFKFGGTSGGFSYSASMNTGWFNYENGGGKITFLSGAGNGILLNPATGATNQNFAIGVGGTTNSLSLKTNLADRLIIKPTGDIETPSEYQKLYIGTSGQTYNGYITGDDISYKKLMLYHPYTVRLSNSPVTNPATNVSDGLYVSNGNKIGINAFPVERVHANVIGSCARFDCAVANSTTLSPEENRERVYIGRDNKMAISFIPMSSNNSWIHMHHTLNDGLQISTGSYVGTNPLVTFKGNGRVGIGTTDPQYSLHVKGVINGYVAAFDGKVRMRSLKCDQTNWADDVFDEKYELMKLDSLDAYIKQNKHLPGIPTTETVQKEGVDITEMNEKFLRRLEENTLYLLELKKENDLLKAELVRIKSQLNTK